MGDGGGDAAVLAAAHPLILMELTAGQCGFFFAYAVAVALWLYAELLARRRLGGGKCVGPNLVARPPADDAEATQGGAKETGSATPRTAVLSAQAEGAAVAPPVDAAAAAPPPQPPAVLSPVLSLDNPVAAVLSLRSAALLEHRLVLRAMAEFGAHMMWYFVCDRTSLLFEHSKKNYSRDVFWFIYVILVVYCFVTSLAKNKAVAYLNRDQTEEWKGWMQVLFLLYHYYEALEQYNSIRLWIAAYVWMTGFGNFSFYYVRADFSLGRFFQMMWRLNFMVFWVCTVLGNDYMLYYICAMHTLWTLFVYVSLLILRQHNEKQWVIGLKWVCCVLVVLAMFSRETWYTLWGPLKPLIGYVNPRAKPGTPGADPMHEWYFRAGLDRYVWIFGMVCANFHPNCSNFLEWIDTRNPLPRLLIRVGIAGTCLAAFYAYYVTYFSLPKLEYNKIHPTTSWIPIMLYIILRNLTPTLRGYSLHFFGFLGKITLETYIGQFHIWMTTAMPNGQPKGLLTLLPGYPLLNFALCTAVYIFVSFRLFENTVTIKNAVLPSKDDRRLWRNVALCAVAWGAAYAVGRAAQPYANASRTK